MILDKPIELKKLLEIIKEIDNRSRKKWTAWNQETILKNSKTSKHELN